MKLKELTILKRDLLNMQERIDLLEANAAKASSAPTTAGGADAVVMLVNMGAKYFTKSHNVLKNPEFRTSLADVGKYVIKASDDLKNQFSGGNAFTTYMKPVLVPVKEALVNSDVLPATTKTEKLKKALYKLAQAKASYLNYALICVICLMVLSGLLLTKGDFEGILSKLKASFDEGVKKLFGGAALEGVLTMIFSPLEAVWDLFMKNKVLFTLVLIALVGLSYSLKKAYDAHISGKELAPGDQEEKPKVEATKP